MDTGIDQEVIDDIWNSLNDVPPHITLIRPDGTKVEYPASNLVYGGNESYTTLNTHAIISTEDGKARAKKIGDAEYEEITPEEEETLVKAATKSQKRKLNYPKWIEFSKKNKLPSQQDAAIFGSWCYLGVGLRRNKEPTRKRTPLKAKLDETPVGTQSDKNKRVKVVVVLDNVLLSDIKCLLS